MIKFSQGLHTECALDLWICYFKVKLWSWKTPQSAQRSTFNIVTYGALRSPVYIYVLMSSVHISAIARLEHSHQKKAENVFTRRQKVRTRNLLILNMIEAAFKYCWSQGHSLSCKLWTMSSCVWYTLELFCIRQLLAFPVMKRYQLWVCACIICVSEYY